MAVVVVKYNSEWPESFKSIKSRLESHLADVDVESIEHVGSTFVPGLAANPIIDIDIIVTRENVQPAIDALVEKGNFSYLGELGIVDHHCLNDPSQVPQRNIYVCVDEALQTRNHIGVRNTLRSNAQLRDEYSAMKLRLNAEDTNIADYMEAKSEVLQKILRVAGSLTEDELAEIEKANRKGGRIGATKTQRLLLREFVHEDEEAFFELESKEEVVRYQTWPPRTREQARDEVVKTVRNSFDDPRTHIELAVEHQGSFIGRVGTIINRQDDPPHADLWFSFEPAWQGKGFATEAMDVFIALLGGPLELEIECDPRNTGSWKLAERLEFERISLTERAMECKGEWVGSLVYRKGV